MNRINNFKTALWIIIGIAAAVGITRFIFGLGVTTNMSDNTPWGFWIGFDVMGGVALAAGGFVIAAINYIFGIKLFHNIARAAILTAFLGYFAVAIGLLFDLGLPWNIWHMIIYWNPHSPLFEVGWCVMLYLSVLTLEFSPVILEKYPNIKLLSSIHKALYKIRIPLVILGIMLSTLHQSSLGSLFLAMPYRLHPLWYSPIIPIIFFVSAICLGLVMVMVENMTSSYLYKKEYELNVLGKLKKYALFIMSFYIILRFADIFYRGAGVFLFDGSRAASLFWIEIVLSIVIPLILFAIPIKRLSINLLYLGAISGVIGIVFNRLNVGGLTHLNNLEDIGTFYFPSLMELSISAGVVSMAMLIFFFFVENFRVWDKPVKEELKKAKDTYSVSSISYMPHTVNRIKFSFIFVFAFSIAFAAISGSTLENKGITTAKVKGARGGDTLIIDGNRDGYSVLFDHKAHQNISIQCAYCHHLNKPDDQATACYECHFNMFKESDVFNHDWHASANGANLKCNECHEEGRSKGSEFILSDRTAVTICQDCHKDLMPMFSKTKELKTYIAPSYTDAMHGLCINCHKERMNSEEWLTIEKPNLANCSNCHTDNLTATETKRLFTERKVNKWVVVP